MNNLVFMAFFATLGTWFVTSLGAATVIFFKYPKSRSLNIMLGFTSGVMVAASFWSLLDPAIKQAQISSTLPAYLVVTIGFLFGAIFMLISDKVITFARHKISYIKKRPNHKLNRIIMLILSITLHNIPEGLAVGVAFGSLQNENFTTEKLMSAITVVIGIALQNFPEGAAISVPLRREGYSRKKSFFLGQISGIVEPISGVLGALLVVHVQTILPYALSFAAGSMILVAVHELIPECQKSQQSQPYSATIGIIAGFALMMLLDIMFS